MNELAFPHPCARGKANAFRRSGNWKSGTRKELRNIAPRNNDGTRKRDSTVHFGQQVRKTIGKARLDRLLLGGPDYVLFFAKFSARGKVDPPAQGRSVLLIVYRNMPGPPRGLTWPMPAVHLCVPATGALMGTARWMGRGRVPSSAWQYPAGREPARAPLPSRDSWPCPVVLTTGCGGKQAGF